MRRWDNYYNFNVLQDDLNTLGKLKISCFSMEALTFWGNAAPELLMVRVPAPSIAPRGSINHVTAFSPSPGGKSLPPASFCIPLLWKIRKKNKRNNSVSLSAWRSGKERRIPWLVELQKGQRMEKRTLAERVGSREPGPDECFSMLGSVSEANNVFLTWSWALKYCLNCLQNRREIWRFGKISCDWLSDWLIWLYIFYMCVLGLDSAV